MWVEECNLCKWCSTFEVLLKEEKADEGARDFGTTEM